jgi:adenylate cyclase
MERKLTAILSADVKGYSRLMGEDDEATVRTLTAHREAMTALIRQHHGRVVDSPGDNLLAEFASVIDAVRCGVEVQHDLKVRNAELPEQRKMEFRIGINIGDVIVEGERLYGDGVNIAARLEGLAKAGGICISGKVFEEVENKLALTYEYLGEQTVKNIAKPVRVYRVRLEEAESSTFKVQGSKSEVQSSRFEVQSREEKGEGQEPRRVGTTVFVLVFVGVVLLGGLIALLYFSFPPLITHHSSLVTQEAQPPLLPLPDKPSIAVLPFVNMSGDPEQEYFSDGITEDLTSDLSKISGLFVIARSSTFTYKGKAVKVQDVGRELGVRYVLEGSIRKAGEQVRINVQLIDTTTGHHLWSERYDRPLPDIFTLQDEVTQQIVAALRVEVLEAELARVRRIPTENLTAYDFFLRGFEFYFRAMGETKKEANAQARQMFEKAVELDPQYAEAYAGLGATYFLDWFYVWNQTPQILEQSSELAHKAIALNASLPEGHLVLSLAYLFKRQHEQAIAEAEQVLALDPNSAEGHRNLGVILVWAGRPEEAIEWIKKGMRLNPRYEPHYLVNLGWAYLHTGRREEALVPLKRALSLIPNSLQLHWVLTICYAELGQEEEAQAEAAEIMRLVPNLSLSRSLEVYPLKDPAMLERERAALRKAGLK